MSTHRRALLALPVALALGTVPLVVRPGAAAWAWWLLTGVVAVPVTWAVLRVVDGRGAVPGRAPAPADPDGEVAALRAQLDALRARADDVLDLRSRVLELKIDADRTPGLEEEVRLLRHRLEGEDGQVAVLKRRIALLEAEASRVPDLERELEQAGRPITSRTLGQVVQRAAGLPDEASGAGAPAVRAVVAGGGAVVGAVVEVVDAPQTDLFAARRMLGVAVRLDDLTLVEGIGPKIEVLLHDHGILTWAGLAATAVDDLRTILDAAGPRYQMHNPRTWPRQADLLARGEWAAFLELTTRLKRSRR